MKYALYFNANSKYDKKADEIIIMYRKRSVGLIEWIKKRPQEQRIIIDISNYDGNILEDIDIFKALLLAKRDAWLKWGKNGFFK